MATAFSKALGTGLRFTAMRSLGIGRGFDLTYGLTDASLVNLRNDRARSSHCSQFSYAALYSASAMPMLTSISVTSMSGTPSRGGAVDRYRCFVGVVNSAV